MIELVWMVLGLAMGLSVRLVNQPCCQEKQDEIDEDQWLHSLRLGLLAALRYGEYSPERFDSQIPRNDMTYEWSLSVGRTRFVDHAPQAFKRLRALINISLSDLEQSLSRPLELMPSQGKSESLFLMTHCKQFVLKSLRGNELEDLKSFLSQYTDHLQAHPESLLPRYVGLVTMECLQRFSGFQMEPRSQATIFRQKVCFVIMTNVLNVEPQPRIKFDFKGSTMGRRTFQDEQELVNQTREWLKKPMDNIFQQDTLKEMDFEALLRHGLVETLQLRDSSVLDTLESDLNLLQSHGFMDYSLLVGVCPVTERSKDRPTTVFGDLTNDMPHYLTRPFQSKKSRGFQTRAFKRRSFILHLSLIDILQKYNLIKWVEKEIKKTKKQKRVRLQAKSLDSIHLEARISLKNEHSVEAPLRYSKRMLEFCTGLLKDVS
ncbi:hypothetical protein EDD86DRAFT_105813 [Gorgonomyces haynaldii]|nr:hypothetical protein EDD86DRAFT_105813 [Gorgonomyces haynaldii]